MQFWVKKEEMTEGKMTDRASKLRPPPPLAKGLDPPQISYRRHLLLHNDRVSLRETSLVS